ncbi:MAG: ArsR family transcriptional regulator [Pseudomonadales bacterium]|jgi:ArsR family transcriptional regulator|uniref:ArsR/SmtB family transcription factor n=1 Tax=Marinobacter maritimus TaxID=277961 RepID=UPI0016432D3F|nr:metalloregulator ArsR/SmtB family transcription factor [Marinobacter maritimus]|tara:strand:+ start:345 stop:746 length:402 start_codon:yes stop_codon:yes gene_type:complete
MMDDRYVEGLKAIADSNRLRLFWLLVQIDERICVAEAMDVLGETHYNVSRNLKILQKAGLVTAQKEGKWVFYTLNREGTRFHVKLLAAVKSIPEHEFENEIKKCRLRLELRERGQCVVGPDSQEWAAIIQDQG